MGIKKTTKDFELIDEVLEDYSKKGNTEIKCPYCGNDMVKEVHENSYEVKCKTEDCLLEVFRGI